MTDQLIDTPKQSHLVYDVGMHKGEDTDYYLKKGFRVISFEADPDLIQFCKQRFKKEIETQQLIIEEGAIIDSDSVQSTNGKVSFFKNEDISVWGTVLGNWAERNASLGATSTKIEVSVVDFKECLQKYGIPYYLKIDIEGMDTVCLKALRSFQFKPSYISIESEKVSFSKLQDEMDLLVQLGFDQFQAINQAKISTQKEPSPAKEGNYASYSFLEGSTGLFGLDLPKNWKNTQQILEKYKTIFNRYKRFGDDSKMSKNPFGKLILRILHRLFKIPGWYDTHAKHSSVK